MFLRSDLDLHCKSVSGPRLADYEFSLEYLFSDLLIVFKTGSGGFPHSALRIVGITLRLDRQCQDNGLVKHWLTIVQKHGFVNCCS